MDFEVILVACLIQVRLFRHRPYGQPIGFEEGLPADHVAFEGVAVAEVEANRISEVVRPEGREPYIIPDEPFLPGKRIGLQEGSRP